MARRALHHKGNVTEFVKIHSLCSLGTWLLILFTGGMILPHWILSPHHKIKLI